MPSLNYASSLDELKIMCSIIKTQSRTSTQRLITAKLQPNIQTINHTKLFNTARFCRIYRYCHAISLKNTSIEQLYSPLFPIASSVVRVHRVLFRIRSLNRTILCALSLQIYRAAIPPVRYCQIQIFLVGDEN